jgi:hypothetical protein
MRSFPGFRRLALLAAQKGDLPTSELLPVELPRHVRPKGCFAAYYVRSIDELLGRTTGRLRVGDIRTYTAHTIGGTAELALLYSFNLCILCWTQAPLSEDYGPAKAAGAWAMQQHPLGQQDRLPQDYWPPEQRTPPPNTPALQDLPGTMGQQGAADTNEDSAGATIPSVTLLAGRIRQLTMPEYTAASGRLDHTTFLELADASV